MRCLRSAGTLVVVVVVVEVSAGAELRERARGE
jgi:hypothetical protein